jgi:hypothetical protein
MSHKEQCISNNKRSLLMLFWKQSLFKPVFLEGPKFPYKIMQHTITKNKYVADPL